MSCTRSVPVLSNPFGSQSSDLLFLKISAQRMIHSHSPESKLRYASILMRHGKL